MAEDVNLYFSQHFEVERSALDAHGAFDISVVSDLPLFVDPFPLFNSGESSQAPDIGLGAELAAHSTRTIEAADVKVCERGARSRAACCAPVAQVTRRGRPVRSVNAACRPNWTPARMVSV